jgi:4-amino-4-deoxy-L-arabinose transferase-like glycosyltransferase
MTSLAGVWQRTKSAALASPSQIPLVVTLLLGASLIFWNLGGAALTHWDEGRTAERAREILVFHDWVTIHTITPIEHLRWGKHLFILLGCIALPVFIFQQDIFRKGS